MKKGLKMCISVICVFVFLCPMSLADDHIHNWIINQQTTGQYEYYCSRSDGHVFHVFKYYSCTGCEQARPREIDWSYPEKVEEHSYTIYVGDAGHAGVGMHGYYYRCSVCNRITQKLFPCSGPPCSAHIYRLKPGEEET